MSDPPAIDGEARSGAEDLSSNTNVALDRLASFLFVTGAILLFLSAFILTIYGVERSLQAHFERVVNESIQVSASSRPPGESIRTKLIESVENSDWVRFWGVKVGVVVISRNGRTWLYVNGQAMKFHYPNRDPRSMTAFHARLLPATANVTASVENNTMLSNSILVAYATIFLTGFFVHNRRVFDHQNRALDQARESRDQVASTARRIAKELDSVRAQFLEVEPAKRQHRDEITRLQSEQQELRAKLDVLAAREHELRGQADRVGTLEEDSQALEELLEEATRDLAAKDAEIRELEQSLKRRSTKVGAAGGKSKSSELLAKRMRTLYPNLEIDDRAVDDIIALRDETTRLRAEECIKRLAEDADNLGFRRKVGGIPNYLSVYEIGFAGKRRLYFARAKNGRIRVLLIGAKNTQQTDLVYIRKIPKGEIL
jgi:hypothetical protein